MAVVELPSQVGPRDVKEYVTEIVYPHLQGIRSQLGKLQKWARGEQPDYLLVRKANAEKRALLKLAKTPLVKLAVDSLAQCLFVDGYRAEGERVNVAGPWRTWNANSFQRHQIGIHRAALTYGYAYARALPGTALDGSNQAVLAGFSPMDALCLYEDAVRDMYPKYALELLPNKRGVRFYDENVYYELPLPFDNSNDQQFFDPVEHGVGSVPFVRYLNVADLDGRTMGEVEAIVAVASRGDKTTFDRLLAQHYNSWKVKTATGIDDLAPDPDNPDAPVDEEAIRMVLEHDTVLATSGENAKFGTLDETDLAGFISAHEQDVEDFAAAAQLPAYLFGKLSNVNADTLAAANWPMTQKLFERKMMFGDAHNQLMRLAAHIEGDADGASDFTASVTWQDTSARSLAAAADAYGKMATMLGIPKPFLWLKLFPQSDVEAMLKHLMDEDEASEFLRYWNNGTPQIDPNGEFIGGKTGPAPAPGGVPGNDPSSRPSA